MTKHAHAEMIKAKVDNMELVVFFYSGNEWQESTTALFPAFHPETEYFLCLPQYQIECLHFLNGGDLYIYDDYGRSVTDFGISRQWTTSNVFMNCYFVLRIKPNKVKRWIAISKRHSRAYFETFNSKEAAKEELGERLFTFHEIEIEE